MLGLETLTTTVSNLVYDLKILLLIRPVCMSKCETPVITLYVFASTQAI